MPANVCRPIPTIVVQHAAEAAFLRNVRSGLARAPRIKLLDLRRLDERIAAHLDGLAVAGELGTKLCEAALEKAGVGEMFAASMRVIESKNSPGLEKLLAVAEAEPQAQRGLLSAFGWVSAQYLQGTIKSLLASGSAFQRQVGIAACAMHQVDPGAALDAAIVDADILLRARALRVAGDCGRRDLLTACVKALADEDAVCRLWASRSAALLGERDTAIVTLKRFALQPGPARSRALGLVLKLIDARQSSELLKALAQDPANNRPLIEGTGVSGDPHYVLWLIEQMKIVKVARLAGESFSMISGLDLAEIDLHREAPADFEAGASDDPDDHDVSMDPDEGLPWPDPEKVGVWWKQNGSRFQSGVRYFMGAPPTRVHCITVLKTGYQRQRIAAAQYLCLLNPGTPLFNTAAPAWRQTRLLDQLV